MSIDARARSGLIVPWRDGLGVALTRILSSPARAALTAAAFFSALVLPRLGSVGLWDPWETHYAEVARSMLERGDLVHPFWQNAWFFSKPPLTMWLELPVLWIAGTASGAGPFPTWLEWGLRMPFALLAISSVGLLTWAVARIVSPRAGLLTGIALSTMPLFDLIARQAVTDVPYLSCLVLALSCVAIAELDASCRRPERWWLAAAALSALGVLAKGLLGVALPSAVFLGTAFLFELESPLPSKARRLVAWMKRVHLLRCLFVFLAIAVPWYAAMLVFDGRDDEGLTFFQRFIVRDHFERLVSGVHTTTPGGTFIYFIEQGGFALGVWCAALPLALGTMARRGFGRSTREQSLGTGALTATLVAFAVSAFAATKFHHYVLSVLPGVAVLIGLSLDELLEHRRLPRVEALLGLLFFALVGHDLATQPRHFIDLFTYNYARPYPDALVTLPLIAGANVHALIGFGFLLVGAMAALAWFAANVREWVFAIALGSTALAAWLGIHHWPAMGEHWTQRELVQRYYALGRPGEPLGAFLMNWKGETFYTRNTVTQMSSGDSGQALWRFVRSQPRTWLLIEHDRVPMLRALIARDRVATEIEPGLNNKFVLIRVDG